MKLVIQRVLEAAVSVGDKEISRIGQGVLVLLGITEGDSAEVAKKYVTKLLKLRIWPEIQKNKPNSDNTSVSTNSENSGEETKAEGNSEPDTKGKTRTLKTWDSNLVDNNFEILIVSQFTLYGILKGNKPDFHKALNPEEAIKIYDSFVEQTKKSYKPERVQTGGFGEYMKVSLVNDGPVTILIDSEKD